MAFVCVCVDVVVNYSTLQYSTVRVCTWPIIHVKALDTCS